MSNKKDTERSGITRRLFINQGISATGAAMLITTAGSLPVEAESAFEGEYTRMARISYDPESDRMVDSFLRVNIAAQEINTDWGPTRVTDTRDEVIVRVGGNEHKVSGSSMGAKLDPRLDAKSGIIAVTWCECDLDTRDWNVYLTTSRDGSGWKKPILMTQEDGPFLHPNLAIDPERGSVWVAFEDWRDGSIKAQCIKGNGDFGPSHKLSRAGRNFRPKIIVTRADGPHGGRPAVAWDSYRNGRYDIYLRVLQLDGGMGPELRVTSSGLWDSCADLAEDLDGNLWITWVRASNELSQMNAMRTVHVRYFDGTDFRYPKAPESVFSMDDYKYMNALVDEESMGFSKDIPDSMAKVDKSSWDGRLSGYTVSWFPRLIVDQYNRVHVFWREGMLPIPPLMNFLSYRSYEGDRWTEKKRLKLDRGANILKSLFDFSVAINRKGIIDGVYDSIYINIGKIASTARRVRKTRLPRPDVSRFKVEGVVRGDSDEEGWPVRGTLDPPARVEMDGKNYRLVFGDTHAHSWTSDGADPADYYYHFARDYVKLDFFGLSDHDFLISNTPGLEAYVSFLPKMMSDDDFVCFQGYEFTSQAMGHRCIVFEGDDKPTFPLGVFNTQRGNSVNTTAELYSFMHRFGVAPDSRVLVTSHNMFQLGNEFKNHDQSLEPLYDVTSLHIVAEKTFEEYVEEGSMDPLAPVNTMMKFANLANTRRGEQKPEKLWFTSWKQCLDHRLALGAYGGSDTHSSNGVGWVTAGLWVEEKTRQSIFDAMFARRSLAVDSFLRIHDIWNTYPVLESRKQDMPLLRADIRFWLDDNFMGTDCRLAKAPVAKVEVRGRDLDRAITKIVFVRDGVEAHKVSNAGMGEARAEWKDDGWSAGPHYYYVRVEFDGNLVGISSPVFANWS